MQKPFCFGLGRQEFWLVLSFLFLRSAHKRLGIPLAGAAADQDVWRCESLIVTRPIHCSMCNGSFFVMQHLWYSFILATSVGAIEALKTGKTVFED
ncbi:hypothetical protein [Vulcanococcus sp.]|uniref:hypothetical protein n=1 Tax=Vulcanococcus sp. TaxID=2856995 RepID=UPI0037D9CADF